MSKLEDIVVGSVLVGLSSDGPVTVVNIEHHGTDMLTVYYTDLNGHTLQQLIGREFESRITVQGQGANWIFTADPFLFRLVSEAKRIKLAHLFDPLLAVHTSKIRPLPHQITAVYQTMLQRQPLKFLLADDPGAGKTIMAGLLIKELIVRGDVKRCLIVAPGGLVEQWQDELDEKFHLEFEIVDRNRINTSRTGNPFGELDFVIARLDQLSRDEDLKAKVVSKEWDLIICDEAHKMAAHFFGNEIKKTKRFKLGELLRDHTRHFLLMTATPHNGKDEDFQLFLQLLDRDRFEGKYQKEANPSDYTDLYRRMIKEDLLTFEEKKLFPERIAYTKEFNLSSDEGSLYKEVTTYVKEEFKRAEKKGEKKKNVVGFALTVLQRRVASSPGAIYHSLKRRRERLEKVLLGLQHKQDSIKDPFEAIYDYTEEDFNDIEDAPDDEAELIEERMVDQATSSETIPEYQHEIGSLEVLERKALALMQSERDSKWDALRDLLSNTPNMFDKTGSRRKLIIFTEHRDTLLYLERRIRRLLGRHEVVVTMHGGIKREQRKIIQDQFTHDKDTIILLATDAAGEGINLQCANLLINYDMPWNPNRVEQRFGRIHRIGQEEVCLMWNLVAANTIEGDVWGTVFRKLDEQRRALGGKVFDVLGKVFRESRLKDLFIDALKYSDDPQRKIELNKVIEGALDKDNIIEAMRQNAIGETSLSLSEIQTIREDLERANARRLQPHFIASFFRAAFEHFGGTIVLRETDRYEIKHVPGIIKNANPLRAKRILPRYERVCFNKDLINLQGKRQAGFLCPGHPLFDAVLELVLQKYSPLLRQGAVLVDRTHQLQEPALLYYLEHEICDERKTSDGNNESVSKQLQFYYLPKSGAEKISFAGYAPYLDFEPAEPGLVEEFLREKWIQNQPEKQIIDYAIRTIVPDEFRRVQIRRITYLDKTIAAVKARLTREITIWDSLAIKLKDKELSGEHGARLNSGNARQRANELEERLSKRLDELQKQRTLINKKPFIVGGALILPEHLISELAPQYAKNVDNRKKSELLAMAEVIAVEQELGRVPQDVSKDNRGWDIESIDPKTKQVYFIEVKGREESATTVTLSRNEILAGLNVSQDDAERYILAIVLIKNWKPQETKYIRKPFHKEPDFAVTSQNYNVDQLLDIAEDPQ